MFIMTTVSQQLDAYYPYPFKFGRSDWLPRTTIGIMSPRIPCIRKCATQFQCFSDIASLIL